MIDARKPLDAATLGQAIIDATFSTTIAKTKTFDLAMKDFTVEGILALLAHGAQRKFNDAVGGADKDATTKVQLAEAMITEWKEGKLAKRSASAPVTDWAKMARKVLREQLGNALSADDLKKFRAMDAAEQNKKLDAWAEAKRDVLDPVVTKRIEQERKAAEAAAGLKVTLAI